MILMKSAVQRTAWILLCCVVGAVGCGDNLDRVEVVGPDVALDEICNAAQLS